MAEAIIDNLISKETVDSFPALTKNVNDSIDALEKLIAAGVELNQKFAGVKVINELVKATEALEKSQADLDAANKKAADAQKKLLDAQAQATEQMNKQRQANADNAKAAADNARATAQNSASSEDLHRALAEITVQLKAVRDEQKRLTEARNAGVITEEQYLKSLADLLATQTTLKNSSQELTAATKNLEKSEASAAGSINQLEADLKLAQQAYKGLSDEEKASPIGKETQEKIRMLSDEVNKQKKSIGDFSSNVGRYAESLDGLFTNVQREISRLNSVKLQAVQAGDPASAGRAERAIQELTRVVQIGEKTNISYSQSVKQIQREFINAAASGNQSSEFISKFRDEVGEAVDKQNDLRAEIKLASSDTKTFDLLRSGVNGLVGAYQTGIGVVSLFGDANEENEKTIRKLVAVQSVANGIQEIGKQLTEHNTLAYKGLAYVQGLYKTATDASAASTERLGAAFKLIGIGLIIAAVAYLIINFDKLNSTADKTKIKINELEGVSKNTKDALKEMGDTAKEISNSSIKELQDSIKSVNDELGLTPSTIEKAQASLKLLGDEAARIASQRDGFNNIGKKSLIESFKDIASVLGIIPDRLDDINDQYTKQAGLVNELILKQQFLNREILNTERSKAVTQILKDAQDANNRILSLQKTGLNQRLSLTESNFELEKIIIERSHQDELKAAKDNESKIYAADSKAKHDLLIAERNFADERSKIIKEYAERDAKARSEIDQRFIQQRVEFNSKIAASDKELPEIRIQALRNGLEAELQLLTEQRKRELAVEGLTQTEKEDIRDKYRQLREKKEQETADKILAMQVLLAKGELNLYQALTANIIAQLEKITSHVSKGLSINNDTFNEFFDSVQTGLENLQKLSFKTDPFGKLVSGLIKFKGNIADTKAVDQYIEGVKELEKQLGQLGDQLVGLGEAAVNASFENQKNAIQEQINLIDQKRDHDIAAIQASQKSEEDKAAAIAIINARADSQKRLQEQRQKQVEIQQARFQKAVTIAKIIAETAAAVIHQFTTGDPYTAYARAAAVGAIGIAQAAIVAVTPIPQYAEGTDNHPGGVALVGDAGKSELVVTPEGKLSLTPDLPTVMNIPAGSIVYPDAKDALANYYGGMTVQKFNSLQNNGEVLKELKNVTKAIKSIPKTSIQHRKYGWDIITNNEGNYQNWVRSNVE